MCSTIVDSLGVDDIDKKIRTSFIE